MATAATTTLAASPGQIPATHFQAQWALLALAGAILPFFFALPPWVAGIALALVAWRALALERQWRQPSLILRVAMVFLGFFAVIASFRGFGGAEAGGAFLVITAALKALESRNRRDFRIVALLVFILLAAVFLLRRSLPLALYAALLIWLATTALLGSGDATHGWRALALRAGRLLATALPIAIALFLLFPRLPGPLFRLAAPRAAAVSGLPATLDPGDIAALASSGKIAFRVHFTGSVPPPAQRYFRGPVFSRYDGKRWLPSRPRRGEGQFQPRGQAVHYRVLERPSGTRYLFALALPARVSIPARLDPRYELLAPRRIWNDTAYTAVSYPDYRTQAALDPALRRANLALPAGVDPKARALAEKWRKKSQKDGTGPAAIVRRALAWFRNEPFYYTLTPGRLRGPNRMDQFLFTTRLGFCEHYASAFAVLMRAAGVPARIVTGYAGGDINPYDGWLVLRQSSAHAWDEVWLAGRGWVRVDPTAVIPASRVKPSAASAAAIGAAQDARHASGDWFWRARNLWDAADTLWAQYVVGYGPTLQHHLLGHFGLGRLGPAGAAFLMAAVVIAAGASVFFLGLLRFRRNDEDPARRLYERWCRRLARRGLQRRKGEGPLDFAARIARLRPTYADEAREVAALYVRARYAEDVAALGLLRRRVRRRLA
jgi:transglutaminase-like putative cysteine protease